MMNFIKWFRDKKDENLSKKLVKRLFTLQFWEWFGVSHNFNNWLIHEKFYDLIPKDWNNYKVYNCDRKYKIITPLMDEINKGISKKASLRFHNVDRGKMNDIEFNAWYENKENFLWCEKYNERKEAMENLEWWEDDVFNKLVECGFINQLKTENQVENE